MVPVAISAGAGVIVCAAALLRLGVREASSLYARVFGRRVPR